MSSAAQEILPPAVIDGRDGKGRFQDGHGSTGGRPKGKPNTYTTEIKDMVRDALEMVGGANYLAMCAITNAPAFLALVGKTLPLKLTGDPSAPVAIMVAQRVIVDPALRDDRDD